MFDFTDKSAIKVDDLLIFDRSEIHTYIENNQILFDDLVLDHSPSKHMAYGYNRFNHLIKFSYEKNKVQKIVLVKEKPTTSRIKMTITYDGSGFHGFQFQTKERTIQGELSKVVSNITGEDILVQGASRTDALVHALEQVVHFDTTIDLSEEKWLEVVNHQCPKDVHILSVEKVHPLFHSRYDVFQKKYIYKIHMGEYNPLLSNYYWFEKDLDIFKMKEAIKVLEGTHNFKSFSKVQEGDLIRTIYHTDIYKDGDILMIEMVGNGFLRYMVRLIVEYLVRIGKHKATYSMSEVLEKKDRSETNHIAPAEGLYLEKIYY